MQSKIAERRKETAYRYYVTTALEIIAENTAAPVQGKYLTLSYNDLIGTKKYEKIDDPAYEARKRLNQMGIEVVENGSV